MHPIRTYSLRALAATAGTAVALSLGACGMLDDRTDQAPEDPQTTPAATATTDAEGGPQGISSEAGGLGDPGASAPADDEGGTDGSAGGTADGSAAGSADGSNTGSDDGSGSDEVGPEDGEPRTASLAGDDSIEVDEDGNGVVPKEALAIDIEDLFVNKYDIPVEEVTCSNDMKIIADRGSQNCEIVTEERSYYGTVAIVGFEGEMVEYELYVPGLDEDELDLSDD